MARVGKTLKFKIGTIKKKEFELISFVRKPLIGKLFLKEKIQNEMDSLFPPLLNKLMIVYHLSFLLCHLVLTAFVSPYMLAPIFVK